MYYFVFKVDKNAMIMNRYIRIPYPALNNKRERDTYNLDGTKIKTAQAKSQGDSSFPTDGHKAILNKSNSKPKTNSFLSNYPETKKQKKKKKKKKTKKREQKIAKSKHIAPGRILTEELSITSPASYHWTVAQVEKRMLNKE